MRYINYYELGSTLYIPIIHQNLDSILTRKKYSFLKSIVICLEDSINLNELSNGMKKLKAHFNKHNKSKMSLKIFIRPRNIDNLKDILLFKNISFIDGFAIPKFDTNNMIELFIHVFNKYKNFYIMPILETKDVFLPNKLIIILNELKKIKNRILVVRIGGEDILNLLNMIRNCDRTIYDIPSLSLVITNILNIFIPMNFHISSPVYSCFSENINILEEEVKKDIENQIFNKTAIHPKQVLIIQNLYKITEEELNISNLILNSKNAVFNYKNRMFEKKTHSNLANIIQLRYKFYGLK